MVHRLLTAAAMSMALLAAVAPIVSVVGCAIVTVPEGVIGGIDLPPDLSLVLREGMREAEVIARFGAPAQYTRLGQITTIAYTEVFQQGYHRLKLFGSRVGPDHTTRTLLHLVFQDDSLKRAWVDVSGNGRETETTWLLGAPESEGRSSAPPIAP